MLLPVTRTSIHAARELQVTPSMVLHAWYKYAITATFSKKIFQVKPSLDFGFYTITFLLQWRLLLVLIRTKTYNVEAGIAMPYITLSNTPFVPLATGLHLALPLENGALIHYTQIVNNEKRSTALFCLGYPDGFVP